MAKAKRGRKPAVLPANPKLSPDIAERMWTRLRDLQDEMNDVIFNALVEANLVPDDPPAAIVGASLEYDHDVLTARWSNGDDGKDYPLRIQR